MIDKYGLYVQEDNDGGDSAHRTGLAYAIKGLLGPREWDILNTNKKPERFTITNYLKVSSGVYRRHPEPRNFWVANPKCFSRDQASRLILGFAVNGDKREIKEWFCAMASRAFFHQNYIDGDTQKFKVPDIMGPGELRNVIRGLNLWYLYPVLVFLDLFFIGDVYTRSKWDGASLYVPDLKYALTKYWTPVAWLANKLNNRTPWLEEALHNHSPEMNGCVELQELFKELEKFNV